MLDFLTHLLDTTGFPPRWSCGSWTPGHGWLHILSDLAIWSAYFAIPCLLVFFVLRRQDMPFRPIFWLFGAFILACGTTHLMEAIIFWHPVYRLAGIIKLLTAIVSWATVVALVPTIPRALAMRSPDELEREIAARKQAEDALQRANAELEWRVHERTAELAQANASLRYEREMLHITLASIGDAVITTDVEGRVTFLNPVAQTLTAWQAEEGKGQPLETVFRIIHGETRQAAPNPALRAVKEGAIVGLANHTILIARDGTERAIEDSAAPIRSGSGEVVGVVLVFRDAAERRAAEAAAQKHQQVLKLVHQIGQPAVGTGGQRPVPFGQVCPMAVLRRATRRHRHLLRRLPHQQAAAPDAGRAGGAPRVPPLRQGGRKPPPPAGLAGGALRGPGWAQPGPDPALRQGGRQRLHGRGRGHPRAAGHHRLGRP
jgi:PAS domain S-box-containing protein